MYDGTSKSSFENLNYWVSAVDEVRTFVPMYLPSLLPIVRSVRNTVAQFCDDESAVKVLVANKSDATELREVSNEDGAAFARKHNMPFFITSARTDTRVSDVSGDGSGAGQHCPARGTYFMIAILMLPLVFTFRSLQTAGMASTWPCYPRVPKFSPYGKRACACAQRPGLPQACGCS